MAAPLSASATAKTARDQGHPRLPLIRDCQSIKTASLAITHLIAPSFEKAQVLLLLLLLLLLSDWAWAAALFIF